MFTHPAFCRKHRCEVCVMSRFPEQLGQDGWSSSCYGVDNYCLLAELGWAAAEASWIQYSLHESLLPLSGVGVGAVAAAQKTLEEASACLKLDLTKAGKIEAASSTKRVRTCEPPR